MSDELPLPNPQPVRDRNLWTPLYTADQMREYAAAAVARERAKWVSELRGCAQEMATHANALSVHAQNIDRMLDAIRSGDQS